MMSIPGSNLSGGAKFAIVAVVLVVAGVLVSIALGPEWTVDNIQHSGKSAAVATCHERWHTDHVRKVTVTAAVGATLHKYDACPG